MNSLDSYLAQIPVFWLGLVASLAASLGTGLGALPVLGMRRVSRRQEDVLQSVAAGIMLAATAFSLITPGVEAGRRLTGSPLAGALIVALSSLVGAACVLGVHRHAPHEHFISGLEGPRSKTLRRTWLFVIAITIHNFPEGMAVGVGFGGGDIQNGLALTVAIFLQNLPEGFVVALGLLATGYRASTATLIAFGTGLVETVGGISGALAVSLATSVLPWGMGFAAGAMLFVISHEIVPETHRNGFEVESTFGLIGGFLLMVVLGAVLGG